jgi:hypothetical protein
MRPLALIAAAAVATVASSAWADPAAIEGRVIRHYQRDAHSPHLFIERAGGGSGWVEVATREAVVLARVPERETLAVGDRVEVVADPDRLRAPEVMRLDAPGYAVAGVTERRLVAAPAQRVEMRGERIFIVATQKVAQRVAAAD